MDPFDCITWWVFHIDTHAVLSGSGTGEFVEAMLNNGLLTTTVDDRYSSSAGSNGIMSYEAHAAQSELEHHRSISLVVARLGLLARDLRQENIRQTDVFGAPTELMRIQQRITELQDLLRRTWHAQASAAEALGYSNRHVPIQSRGVFEHVSRRVCQLEAVDFMDLLNKNPTFPS